jgi:Dit-like tail protein
VSTTPQPVMIRPYRAIAAPSVPPLIADAVIDELSRDELQMTEQPVETGSTITDHAFNLPQELDLTYGWALGSSQNSTKDPSFLKNLYQQFLALQSGKVLLTVYTGKRIYQNMLIRVISVKTDKTTENVLLLQLSLKQVIFATTSIVNVNPNDLMSLPQKTANITDRGVLTLLPAPNFNASAAAGIIGK